MDILKSGGIEIVLRFCGSAEVVIESFVVQGQSVYFKWCQTSSAMYSDFIPPFQGLGHYLSSSAGLKSCVNETALQACYNGMDMLSVLNIILFINLRLAKYKLDFTTMNEV